MAHTTDTASREAKEQGTESEAWQKLTPAADTTIDVKTDAATPSPSVREHSPQSATGASAPDITGKKPADGMAGRGAPGDIAPERAGNIAFGNDLPHGMSADVPDDALGGTMAQGAATSGTATRARRHQTPNPDSTDTPNADEDRKRTHPS